MLKKHTFAVTLGFPSLSPPIQVPNFMGVQVSGSGFPVCCKMDRLYDKKKIYKKLQLIDQEFKMIDLL